MSAEPKDPRVIDLVELRERLESRYPGIREEAQRLKSVDVGALAERIRTRETHKSRNNLSGREIAGIFAALALVIPLAGNADIASERANNDRIKKEVLAEMAARAQTPITVTLPGERYVCRFSNATTGPEAVDCQAIAQVEIPAEKPQCAEPLPSELQCNQS